MISKDIDFVCNHAEIEAMDRYSIHITLDVIGVDKCKEYFNLEEIDD